MTMVAGPSTAAVSGSATKGGPLTVKLGTGLTSSHPLKIDSNVAVTATGRGTANLSLANLSLAKLSRADLD